MIVYILIALLFFLFRNSENRVIQILCIFLLFLLGAFRAYTVGTDTGNTYQVYEGVYGIVEKEGEFGLRNLTNFLLFHGYGMRWELIITQAIFIGSISLFCFKTSKKMLFTLLLFILCGYIYMSYNITRQMLAFSIILWAYYNRLEKQNWMIFIIIIAIATIIHVSAIASLLLFFYNKIHINRVATISILLLSFFIPQFVSTDSLLGFFVDYIYLWNRFFDYVGMEERGTFSINRLLMNLLYIYIIFKYYLLVKDDLFLKSIIIGLVIINLFPTTPIITRIALYFTAVQPVFLSRFISFAKRDDCVIVSVFVIAVYANFLLSNNGGIVPYDFGGF